MGTMSKTEQKIHVVIYFILSIALIVFTYNMVLEGFDLNERIEQRKAARQSVEGYTVGQCTNPDCVKCKLIREKIANDVPNL
jgi:hypothetical protein